MLILYIFAAVLAICLAVFIVTFILLEINMRPGKAPELAQVSVAKRTRWAPYAETVSRLILELRELPWEDVYTDSFDGLRLHARLLRGNGEDNVILVHGYRSSGENDFAGIAQYYITRGFGVLLVDQRAHGQSEGRQISFGTRERDDVRRWWSARKPISAAGSGCTAYPWARLRCSWRREMASPAPSRA